MKILIFRALKIGDMLCALPAIKNLHEFFPQSSISIVALPYMVPFLERYSTYFDSIIPFSGYPGLPEIPFDKIQYQKMVERIRKEKFDLLIQMHGDGSRIEGMMLDFRIPCVWSFSPKSRQGFFTYPVSYHEIHKHNALLNWYGVPTPHVHIPFPILMEDYVKFEELLMNYEILGKPFVVIHPGASCKERRWGIHNFAKVMQIIHIKGYTLLLSGVKKEMFLAEELKEYLDFSFINMMGVVDLGLTALLLKHSKGLITNCTGVSHIGAATSTKSIVISKDGDVGRWAPLNKEIHKTFDCSQDDKLKEVIFSVEQSF